MRSDCRQFGITLIEILVVVGIISLLLGALYMVGHFVGQKGDIALAESQMHLLASALEDYHDAFGEFPDAHKLASEYPGCSGIEIMLDALTRHPSSRRILQPMIDSFRSGDKKYLVRDEDKNSYREIYDPWNKILIYFYDPQTQSFPDVISAGPDGKSSTGDDIKMKGL